MKKVIIASTEEKEALEGFYKNGAELRFVLDEDDNWVVNINVLYNSDFEEIHSKLSEMPLIDFKEKQFVIPVKK